MEKKRVTGYVFTAGQRSSQRAALGYDGFQYCLSHCWLWLLVVVVIPSHHLPQVQLAFASHRVTTCRRGRFLLSVLNGTRLCRCAVTRLLCIRATFCHSESNVTFIRFTGVLWGRLFNGPNRWLYESLPGLLHCVVGVSFVPFVPNTDDLRQDKVGNCVVLKFWFQHEMVHCFPCS